MPSLRLFGTRLDGVPAKGTKTFTNLGGSKNHGKVTTVPISGETSVAIEFSGDIPAGYLDKAKWTIICRLTDAAFVPVRVGASPLTGSIAVTTADYQLNEGLAEVAIIAGRGDGFGFVNGEAFANNLLDALEAFRPTFRGLEIPRGLKFVVLPDFTARATRFVARGDDVVTYRHRADYTNDGGFCSEQTLGALEIAAEPDSFALLAARDAFFIHGDFLDKRSNDAGGGVFFQQALANGRLAIRFRRVDFGQQPVEIAWVGRDRAPPVLLALRWHDENGAPLAFSPKDEFLLEAREGFELVATVIDGPDRTEKTNITPTVIPRGAHDDWTLRLVDPAAIYHNPEGPTRWLVEGRVPIAPRAPSEVHGLARGTILRQPKREARAPIDCRYTAKTRPNETPNAGNWRRHEVALGGDWVFDALLEERDSSPAASGSTLQGAPSVRNAPGQSGRRVHLPLTDTKIAAVNLAWPLEPGDAAPAYSGEIATATAAWLDEIDGQFFGDHPWLVHAPQLEPNVLHEHRTGLDLKPEPSDELATVTKDQAAVTSTQGGGQAMLARLRRSGPTFRPPEVSAARYALAVPPSASPSPGPARPLLAAAAMRSGSSAADAAAGGKFDAVAALDDDLEKRATAWQAALDRFAAAWTDPETYGIAGEAAALAGVLGLPTGIDTLLKLIDVGADGDDNDRWDALLEQVRDVARRGGLDSGGVYDSAGLLAFLAPMVGADLKQVLRDDPEPLLAPLTRWLQAPPTAGLYRRIATFLLPALSPNPSTVDQWARIGNAAALDGLRKLLLDSESLTDFASQIFQGKTPEEALAALFDEELAGMVLPVDLRGEDILADLREFWAEEPTLKELRDRFGGQLTDDVAVRLRAAASDLAQFVAEAAQDLGIDPELIEASLLAPPDYLFVSSRFTTAGADRDKALRLWAQRFHLAQLGNGAAWKTFLGENSSILVKLGDKRAIPEILRELHATHRSGRLPDPLGLTSKKHPEGDEALAAFIAALPADVSAPGWRGALFLRPMADIGADKVLADLCGFDQIDTLFVAIAGRPLADGRPDVAALISAETNDLKDADGADEAQDLRFGLVKFKAEVNHSALSSADIRFRIVMKSILGHDNELDPGDRTIDLIGTLPPADPAKPDAPRDLTFAAVLNPGKTFKVDVLCLKEVTVSAIRVGRASGSTYLDVDATLQLQDLQGYFEANGKLILEGLKIKLPERIAGVATALGVGQWLSFDWPSVTFPIPPPKAIALRGLDIVPTAVGYCRSDSPRFRALTSGYGRLRGFSEPDDTKPFGFPHVFFRLSFGKLPLFGDAASLSFDIAIGVPLRAGNNLPGDPWIGIKGLSGTNLTIDLFRVVTLTITSLFLGECDFVLPDRGPKMTGSGLLIDDAVLKILGWNPLGDGGSVSLGHFHRDDKDGQDLQRDAMIAGIKSGNSGPKGFIDLHWVVVAKSLVFSKAFYNYLLGMELPVKSASPGEAKKLLKDLIQMPNAIPPVLEKGQTPSPPPAKTTINAGFDKAPNWLFGISLSIGEDLLPLCTLVLHDQHYYGIRLRADWVQYVFGQESIELAYIPGPAPDLDRFRTNLRLPFLDMLGPMRSGEFALEWGFNWDFLIDVGFPWNGPGGYDWFRAFSVPAGCYEAKFGFFLEKKTELAIVDVPGDDQHNRQIVIGAGLAIYAGLFAGFGNGVAWARVGIGVFGIFTGRAWLTNVPADASKNPLSLLRASLAKIEVEGVIGILAYGEGGIDIWIISARFRIWVQASIATNIVYVIGGPCAITWTTTLACGYYAAVRVGRGWFSWTFSVSGTLSMPVSGRLVLS